MRHVLLVGYATDMCFCRTTAGYENLSKDFNVFLVGDATLATFPANNTPRYATNAHISFAALNQLVTQCSWIKSGRGYERRAGVVSPLRQSAFDSHDVEIIYHSARLARFLGSARRALRAGARRERRGEMYERER